MSFCVLRTGVTKVMYELFVGSQKGKVRKKHHQAWSQRRDRPWGSRKGKLYQRCRYEVNGVTFHDSGSLCLSQSRSRPEETQSWAVVVPWLDTFSRAQPALFHRKAQRSALQPQGAEWFTSLLWRFPPSVHSLVLGSCHQCSDWEMGYVLEASLSCFWVLLPEHSKSLQALEAVCLPP